ncbi:hypothetical protein ES319_A08G147000v1 [Gossypium barbadense]|uniref:Uncharacterized protein n=2 Tax=Gossypium TaxID=3633 RepID=A0A5J5US05_GOSBA|nr:hypothetical protein ES319_A08G147000v1 [Gossypium barbadense]TYH06523.1 hypothetical protein ES288_A08G161500v1 [Gossypium darwinii]
MADSQDSVDVEAYGEETTLGEVEVVHEDPSWKASPRVLIQHLPEASGVSRLLTFFLGLGFRDMGYSIGFRIYAIGF